MTKLTKRQREILEQAAKPYGVCDHTHHDYRVLSNLFDKDLVFLSCNGSGKWFATQLGTSALAQTEGHGK
jgi:hypothetical protein